MSSVDIATGTHPIQDDGGMVYSSVGLPNTYGIKNEVIPTDVLQVCYLLDVNGTCTEDQKGAILNGSAVNEEYMVVDRNSTMRYLEIVGTGFED